MEPYLYHGMSRDSAIKNSGIRVRQEIKNAGFSVDITSLEGIRKRVTDERFYIIKPSDYIPISVGEHAFADDILTYTVEKRTGNWRTKIFDPGNPAPRIGKGDVKFNDVRIPTRYYIGETSYNLIDIQQGRRAGSWSLIEMRERTIKEDWREAIQEVAFLGFDSTVRGLLNLEEVELNTDTDIIGEPISEMNEADFKTLTGAIIPAYYKNANNTMYPNRFIMPTDDFLGLHQSVSGTFNNVTKYQRLLETFISSTGRKDFKILPLSYAEFENSRGVLTQDMYVLLNYDPSTIKMDIPVDLISGIRDTVNGFEYSSVSYGQFSGVGIYRPLEVLYFQFS